MANVLDSVATLPDGTQVLVKGEAQDIVRRVREGDPSLGWEGDPEMRVVVSPYVGLLNNKICMRFEVWAFDNQRQPYVAVVSDTCGPELIHKLIAADGRRNDVIERTLAATKKVHDDQQKQLSEKTEEAADKLAFALVKDNGVHYGSGLTKQYH